jgi:phosphate transport system permease protein
MIGRKTKDTIANYLMIAAVFFVNFLAISILLVLLFKAWPIFSKQSIIDLLFSKSWHPSDGSFGFFTFIVGTLEVTAISMVLSVPVCILSAIYLAEYAKKRTREMIMPVIDILAGIPSVVYGLFGVIIIVPFVKSLGMMLGISTSGYSLLSGGIILGIMVFPVIISVATEVFLAVPNEAREAALALGSTKWEVAKKVVIKSSLGGIFAAVVLGFSRAFGETMAVLMVVGNVAKIPGSLFDPAYPLTALIANNYGEMMSIPLYDSALMLSALILMIVVAVFNILANITLSKIEKRSYNLWN